MFKNYRIVYIVGSDEHRKQIFEAGRDEVMNGNIVLSPQIYLRYDPVARMRSDNSMKNRLWELSKARAELCDDLLVVNYNGFIDDETRRIIYYKKMLAPAKVIRYLEPLTF